MKTILSLVYGRAKILMTVLLTIFLFTGCDDWFKDPGPEFPDCVGTKHSFDPYSVGIYDQYFVTLTGADVIATEFFFTNYSPGTLLSYPNFHLWVKSIVDQNTTNY